MTISILLKSTLDGTGIEKATQALRELVAQSRAVSEIGGVKMDELLGVDQGMVQSELASQSAALSEMEVKLRQAAAAAFATGNSLQGMELKKRADEVKQYSATLDSLVQKKGTSDKGIDALLGMDKGEVKKKLSEQVTELGRVEAKMRQASAAAFAMGDSMKGIELKQRAEEARKFADTINSVSDGQKRAGGMADIMNSSFNRLGFTLFVTMATLKQVKDMMVQAFQAAEEGASALDKITAFNTLSAAEGFDGKALRASLEEAAQGVVSFEVASTNALRLIKGGFPEIANESDKILQIAVNAAKVSGELENTELIYDKLVRGIIRGSPRLIDDADIVLKLGDAYEQYAATLGKSADALTRQEQVVATFNAVMDEGARINEMAESFDSAGISLAKFKTDMSEAGTALKMFLAEIASALLDNGRLWKEDFGETLRESFGASEAVVQTFIDKILTIKGMVGTLVATFAAGGAAIKSALQGVFDTIKLLEDGIVSLVRMMGVVATNINDPLEMFKKLNDELARAPGRDDLIDFLNDQAEGWGSASATFEKWMDRFALLPSSAKDADNAMSELGDTIKNALNTEELDKITKSIDDLFDPLSDANIGRELAERKIDISEQLSDKLFDIEQNRAEKLADINAKMNEKLLELAEDYKERRGDIIADLRETIAEISQDMADELEEIEANRQEGEASAAKDRAKTLEDIERDKQEALLDIEREYAAKRLQALIDRDARALFEADQTRQQDTAEVIDDAAKAREQAEKDYAEEMAQIKEQSEKKRQEAIEAAEQRRKDAAEAAEKALADLKERYEKEQKEAREAAEKQRREAKDAADKARRDAQDSYRDRLDDLQDWYNEQLRRQREQKLREQIQLLEKFAEEETLTQEHLNRLLEMREEYERSLGNDVALPEINIPGSPNSGGGSGGGSGNWNPGVPDGVYEGGGIGVDWGVGMGIQSISATIKTDSPALDAILSEIAAKTYFEIETGR